MDRTLVEAARFGDVEAFDSIARGAADRLFVVAHRILRDADLAQDAVQHALVTAWRELPGLREVDRFDAWMNRILVHACYAEARRARAWGANIRLLPVDGPSVADSTTDVITRDVLDRGFRRLPAEQRAILVLHHYLGLRLGEIAETLDIPLGTVKSRLHHATNAIRAAIEADSRLAPTSRERMA